ncbi:MAG: response regulator [Magnetococcales bacterium]|nr:response regulator [Magnetococcales bacterium]
MTDSNETMEQPRILAVDDVPSNIKALVTQLRDAYRISVATSGQQALDVARNKKPDLILLDVMMPGMDGYEVCRHLKADEATREIPVIFVTGKSDVADETRGLGLGAVDYITKPISLPIVQARIRTQLGLKQARERLESTIGKLDRANKFIRKTFGRFMSDEVVASLLDAPDGLALGGERKQVTIMMSDLRGFTLLSEEHQAEQVVGMLNMYLEAMTDIILKYQGTIIEFLGDGILVLFGAPNSRDDDAQRAVACALEMQLAMAQVNENNRALGFPEFGMGVGLNTGPVIAGNIGSDKRSKYGVVGRPINRAARIESLTVGGQILISDETMKACGSLLRLDESWEVMPKGVPRPITIHQVGGIGGHFDIQLPKPEEIPLEVLHHPLQVRILVMEGKHAGQQIHEGQVMALTLPQAELKTDLRAERLTNLNIHLLGEGDEVVTDQLYGKVVTEDKGDGRLRIHFTSFPKEAERYLSAL